MLTLVVTTQRIDIRANTKIAMKKSTKPYPGYWFSMMPFKHKAYENNYHGSQFLQCDTSLVSSDHDGRQLLKYVRMQWKSNITQCNRCVTPQSIWAALTASTHECSGKRSEFDPAWERREGHSDRPHEVIAQWLYRVWSSLGTSRRPWILTGRMT